jgi:hypothetical protein
MIEDHSHNGLAGSGGPIKLGDLKDRFPCGNTIPTYVPNSPKDQFYIYLSGTTQRLYVYDFNTIPSYYCIAVEYSGGSAGNEVYVGGDDTAPTHAGNASDNIGGTWSAYNTEDWIFYVYNGVNVVDSYTEANYHGTGDMAMRNGSAIGCAQSFDAGTSNQTITSCKFYLYKTGLPNGNAYAKLYSHSGVFGTSSIPSGSALATSDAYDVTALGGAPALITFTFSTPYTTTPGSVSNGWHYITLT